MKEAYEAALTEILTSVVQAKDFIVAQVPDVVQQILAWYSTYYFIMFIVGVLLIFGIVALNYYQYKLCKKNWDKISDAGAQPGFMLNLFQLLWGIPLSGTLNLQWLKIWIAPKLWLIEFAAGLTK